MIERFQNIITTLKVLDKESKLRSSIYGQGYSTDELVQFFRTGETQHVGFREIWKWFRKSKSASQ